MWRESMLKSEHHWRDFCFFDFGCLVVVCARQFSFFENNHIRSDVRDDELFMKLCAAVGTVRRVFARLVRVLFFWVTGTLTCNGTSHTRIWTRP